MIILRYLSRELLQTTFAVSSVLLVIIMSGRFIKYLAEAAAGKMDVAVLFSIMFYRLPGFLELIVPLGFFVALLMAYGRLYSDHEMTVLFSCGMSRKRLIAVTYVPALFIALIIALLSLWLSPIGLQKTEEILAQQQARSDFDTMQASRFQFFSDKTLVGYTETISDDRQQLQAFFLANVGVASDRPLMVVRAKTAERINNTEIGHRYLLLREGVRYEGRPGQADYRVTEFDSFAQYIKPPTEVKVTRNKVNRLPSLDLLASPQADHQAALQWRLSAPLLVLVVTLLGITFSYTNPRRGRYAMLFPAILLYLIYLVLLNTARGAVEEGRLPATIGLWGVHSLFFLFGVVLLVDKKYWRRLNRPVARSRAQAPKESV